LRRGTADTGGARNLPDLHLFASGIRSAHLGKGDACGLWHLPSLVAQRLPDIVRRPPVPQRSLDDIAKVHDQLAMLLRHDITADTSHDARIGQDRGLICLALVSSVRHNRQVATV
jgi:hypothetical protein